MRHRGQPPPSTAPPPPPLLLCLPRPSCDAEAERCAHLALRRKRVEMVQYWRAAGLTYLKFCQVGSNALRQGLKEPARSKALKGGGYAIVRRQWADGKIAETFEVTPEGMTRASKKGE